jgi:hypothetical protein
MVMDQIRQIIDREFIPKVDKVGDKDFSVRYYREGETMGVVRATLYESVGKTKPIRQRNVIISEAQVGGMFSHLLTLINEEDLGIVHEVLFKDVREKILTYPS